MALNVYPIYSGGNPLATTSQALQPTNYLSDTFSNIFGNAQNPGWLSRNVFGTGNDPITALSDAYSGTSKLVGNLTSASLWERIIFIVLGVVFIGASLLMFAKKDVNITNVVKAVTP